MRKPKIIETILSNLNSKANYEKYSKDEIEEVLEEFKKLALECCEKNEEFKYVGFIEITTKVEEAKTYKNPKTSEEVLKPKCLRSKINLAYAFKRKMKNFKIK